MRSFWSRPVPPLEGDWNQERSHVSATLDQMAGSLRRIEAAMYGDEERQGLRDRLLKLEDNESRRERMKWIWVTALVTAFVVQSVTIAVAVPKALANRGQGISGK
jgi:hypothetical protein